MKKTIALALAMALSVGSATVAMAAQSHDMGYFDTFKSGLLNSNNQFYPDENYYFQDSGLDLDTKNFSVSAKWTKGGAMIKSVSIDNAEDAIKVTTNSNYTLEETKDIVGEITLTAKKDMGAYKKGDKLVFEAVWGMSNDSDTIYPYENWEDAENDPLDPKEHTIYTADSAGKYYFNSESSLLQIKASLKDNQKILMTLDEDTIYDVIDLLDEKNVEYNDLAFYSANGKFSFTNGRAEAVINSDFETKPYIYAWNGTALTQVANAEWNEDEGTYTVGITGPTQYVLSDVQLKAVAANDNTAPNNNGTTANPDTGANDFVGLAVALAVVSVAGIVVAKKH